MRNFWFRSRRFQSHISLSRVPFRDPRGHVVSPRIRNTEHEETRRFVSNSLLGCNSSFSLFVISFHDCLFCFHDFFSLSLSRRYVCILYYRHTFFFLSLVSVTRFSTKQHAYDFCPNVSYSFSSFLFSFFFFFFSLSKTFGGGDFHQESRDSKTLAVLYVYIIFRFSLLFPI